MLTLLLVASLSATSPDAAPLVAEVASAPAVGVGTGAGILGGAVVGAMAGGAAFMYGFHLCFSADCPRKPLGDVALIASPFLALGGVVAGSAGGAAIAASLDEGDVGTAAGVGAVAGLAALVPPIAVGAAALTVHADDTAAYAGIAAASVVGVVGAGIVAQMVYNAREADSDPPPKRTPTAQAPRKPEPRTLLEWLSGE